MFNKIRNYRKGRSKASSLSMCLTFHDQGEIFKNGELLKYFLIGMVSGCLFYRENPKTIGKELQCY